MKKKFLSVLAVAAVSAVALVGCGGDDHTHDYKWKFEGDKHWQECECGEKTGEAAHVDEKVNATGEAGKDELCDVCGANLHAHVYQWNSTALVHWQECECGDKTAEAAHVDEKNNETGAESADEKCDVCGRGFYAVTFNLDGHGTVATQYIGKDGKVVQPETPADDDSYKFKGWYKDAAHQTAFDFATDTITSATEIYAWFEDDTTPGASKKYAYKLELDLGNAQKAKKDEVVYYSFKAPADGRYTLSLGMGTNNENATFTTTKTGETVYGKDCDLAEITVDIDKNETVYILFTFLGEEGDDVSVSPIVTEVTNEPMPADYFLKGEYYNVTNELEITNRTDAEHQTLTFNGASYTFRYIGGKYDRIYFVQSTAEQGNVTYYLSYSNGTYKLTNDSNGSSASTLWFGEEQDPVDLSDIVGYYEPVSTSGGSTSGEGEGTLTPRPSESDRDTSSAKSGIIGIYIYDNTLTNATTVRYVTRTVDGSRITIAYSDLISATYDTAKNKLSFDQYVARPKLNASGEIEAIVVNGVEFVCKGEAGVVPPENLGLETAEYIGTTYAIRTTSYSQYFGATGADAIYVMGYDDTSSVYTVHVVAGSTIVEYKLTIAEDKKTISLYEKDGTTLLDTLTKFEWVFTDLPTVEITADLTANDFQKGLRLYKVQEAGWYSFTIPENAKGWKNLNPNDYTDFENAVEIKTGAVMYLNADELIAVYMETPAAVSVSVARPEAPVGTSESNPKALENGAATLDAFDLPAYYFTYTAPSAGDYLVNVLVDGYNVFVLYNVNGTPYGYGGAIEGWYGGVTYSNPYAAITVEDNLTLNIQVVGQDGWQKVTVSVSEDYSASATDLTLTGTPADNSLTATATAATGASYHIASTKGESVTVTGSAAFTVKVQGGDVVTAEQSGESFTATIPAGKDVYFKLESATQQTLTLSQTFAKGTEGYPEEVNVTGDTATITLRASVETEEGFEIVRGYYKVTAGSYSVSAPVSVDGVYVGIYVNGVQVFTESLTLKDGDVLCIEHDDDAGLTVTLTKLNYLFTEEQAGTYKGTGAVWGDPEAVTLTFDRFGNGTITVASMDGGTPFPIEIKLVGGVYRFTYNEEYSATISFEGGNILFNDSAQLWFDEAFTMKKPIDGRYTGLVAEYDSEIIIEADGTTVTYISADETMANKVTLTYNAATGTYSFTYYMGTVTLAISGNTIEVDDAGLTGTLTKQA
ncbi:MAG: InlB B-repeat-containing protein [Clostridiales bacterium]|nr:InlB B-repeat-containing protein [Clostridiales bacterium]